MKANTNRRSRFAFGVNSRGYDRGRMPFSDGIVDWALAKTGFRSGDAVLEIGAGSGQLTEGLLRIGANVTALEPSVELANLLHERCTDTSCGSLNVSHDTFECFEATSTFSLIVAANSFHWLDPRVSYRKASEIVDGQGGVCLFWYFPILADMDLQQHVNSCVRDHGLDDLAREPQNYVDLLQQLLADGRNELDASRYLRSRDWILKPRCVRYTVAQYCDLLGTYASSKNVMDLQHDLSRVVFRDVQRIELVLYEYACVAGPV